MPPRVHTFQLMKINGQPQFLTLIKLRYLKQKYGCLVWKCSNFLPGIHWCHFRNDISKFFEFFQNVAPPTFSDFHTSSYSRDTGTKVLVSKNETMRRFSVTSPLIELLHCAMTQRKCFHIYSSWRALCCVKWTWLIIRMSTTAQILYPRHYQRTVTEFTPYTKSIWAVVKGFIC